jgi:hypothetical protein
MAYFPLAGILIEPFGQTALITISIPPFNNNASLFSDSLGQNPVANPQTISSRTTFFMGDGTYFVSAVVSGQETAGVTVLIEDNEVATVSLRSANSSSTGGPGFQGPPTFYVDDPKYAGSGDTAALNAAYTDAKKAGSGIVQFAGRKYTFTASSVQPVLSIRANTTGTIVFQGEGIGNTILQLSANTPSMFGTSSADAGVANTIQNYTFQDFTVDGNNVQNPSSSSTFGVAFDGNVRCNYSAIYMRRVNTINVFTPNTAQNDRRNFHITIATTPDGMGLSGGLGSSPRTDASCNTTQNSTTVTDAAITSADLGMVVSGTGILPLTKITSVNAGVSFVMSNPASATGSGVSLSIGNVPLYTVTDVHVEDCNFSGGNFGCIVQGFFTNALGNNLTQSVKFPNVTQDPNVLLPTPLPPVNNLPYTYANVYIDRVFYERCYHNFNILNQGTNPGSNFMIGGYGIGGRWKIISCEGWNSGDDGIEVDSGADIIVENCIITDSYNSSYYLSNIGGNPGRENQVVRFINNESRRWGNTHNAHLNMCQGNNYFSNPIGRVVIENFHGSSRTPAPGTNDMDLQADIRHLIMRDINFEQTGTFTLPSTQTSAAMRIGLWGTGDVNISNFSDTVNLDITGTNTQFVRRGISFSNISDHAILLDNINIRHQANLHSTAKLVSQGIHFGDSVGFAATEHLEPWPNPGANKPSIASDWYLDAGTLTDVTQTTNNLAPTASTNLAVEKRFTWAGQRTDATFGRTGVATDGAFGVDTTVGATASGWKTGAMARVDASNYLEAWLDGTNNQLHLDKVSGGTRTSNLSAAAAFTIAASTQYAVAIKKVGPTVVAQAYTTRPANFATGTPTASVTYTMTAAEQLQFKQSFWGFSWIPADNAAHLGGTSTTGVQKDDMSVFTGTIRNYRPTLISNSSTSGSNTTDCIGFLSPLSVAGSGGGQIRIPGKFRIEQCDFTALTGNANQNDIKYTESPPTLGKNVHAERITYFAPPAAAAITVGASPFTYTNSDGYAETVGVIGGTVSNIAKAPDGVTFTQVCSTNTAVQLSPGEAVQVTYSAAPTMNKVPVL